VEPSDAGRLAELVDLGSAGGTKAVMDWQFPNGKAAPVDACDIFPAEALLHGAGRKRIFASRGAPHQPASTINGRYT